MIVGRFALANPALALAGLFAAQRGRFSDRGTIHTDSVTFCALVLATAVIVCGWSFLPVLTLAPVLDHLLH